MFHQLALRTDAVERLQQKCSQQPLGGDRGSPFGRIQLSKLAIEGGEDLVDDAADQPQRMAHRHPLFEVDIGKQFTRP